MAIDVKTLALANLAVQILLVIMVSRAAYHVLIYDADFSEIKMKFAVLKGQVQFGMRRRLGNHADFAVRPFEMLTDAVFRVMR